MFEILEFYTGKEVQFDSLARRLSGFGYRRQDQVTAQGEFSIRGGVVDVFPVHFSLPLRIELSDEAVESIHTFDPATGKRLEPHHMAVVIPIKGGRPAPKRLPVSLEYDVPVDPFVDIRIGDTVVHILHGIARYRGMKALKNKENKEEDHFVLEFADKNILYVPTRDLHYLQRYVAFGKIKPQLSRLGSKSWERLKEKTRKGVLSFASELLQMQAKRKALQGFRCQKDTEWQRQLEEEFPYDETEDQLLATGEAKRDLE